ncbi:response regulator transcription factor [Gorillibacterium sp. sgz5001074]|uniref:response regulator transcription factor n=1 Tax=Gorillibacterium sp. sgz5001074 TaxID=3446695 RepID=UPI003F66B305
MYKVMLVDDDVPMLDYIGGMLDWSSHGLEIAGETFSSELALDLFRRTKPDLVITDIGLPVMDGIELAQRMRKIHPEVRIIFLTCYEEASYLKKAFQLDADDYLIKDELTERMLSEAVGKSLKWVRGREESLEKIAYRSDIERNKDVLKQQFFEQVLKGGSQRETLQFGERLGIRWTGEQLFMLQMVHPDTGAVAEAYDLADLPLLLYAVYNIALELAVQDGHITPFLYKDDLYLVCHDRAGTKADSTRYFTFTERLMEKTRQFLKIGLYPVQTAEWVGLGGIGTLYKKLHRIKEMWFYSDNGRLPAPAQEAPPLPEPEEFKKERAMAAKAFEDGNPVFLDLAVDGIRAKAKHKRYQPPSLLGACEELVRYLAGEFHFQPAQTLFGTLQRTVRLEEAVGVLKGELKKGLKQTLSTEPVAQDASLAHINRFIEDHIHETVTSIDAANHLRLNSSYFSRLFKKKTGINFTEYVHQYKMKMAKRLLDDPEETVENVAYTLGYSDRAYFSKVFKKVVGTSPSEYKHSR